MARQTQPGKLEAIYSKVAENPGERPGSIACLLGLHRSEVLRSLPALEEKGYLLSEDERGRLWPFEKKC
jgi:DNA-binding IclR family transcriptional regulator